MSEGVEKAEARVTTVYKFVTTDGKVFDNKREAIGHQRVVDYGEAVDRWVDSYIKTPKKTDELPLFISFDANEIKYITLVLKKYGHLLK